METVAVRSPQVPKRSNTRAQSPHSAPVELAELRVNGLFGRYDYAIRFPHVVEGSIEPSLVILHGQNGVGKTTLLLMLDGLLDLDFDVFRIRPFRDAALTLSTGQELSVTREKLDGPLAVSFGDLKALLHPRKKGAYEPSGDADVEAFRTAFRAARRDISFQLVTTGRYPQRERDSRLAYEYALAMSSARHADDNPEARIQGKIEGMLRPTREPTLASEVRQFILDAQVNYRQFFRFESDLFGRIINVVTAEPTPNYDVIELRQTIDSIDAQDRDYARLGITPDQWEHGRLTQLLGEPALSGTALAVLGAYIEGLDARARERAVLANRLLTFEAVMGEFLLDKSVRIDARNGLKIETFSGDRLLEDQLSSGEYHLLFLMVTALLARSRGSLIAIDEPEMSMHISWQHRLIRSLFRCASDARPQLILATHSPDVAAEYREFMVRLGPQ